VETRVPVHSQADAGKFHSATLLLSLTCEPNLEPVLYQRLKQWVANEEDYIRDNREDLELEMK